MDIKKRGVQLFILVIFTVLFCVTASAEESVFSDDILSGESIDIDDFTFIITMNKYANQIFIDAGSMFQSVDILKCKKMETFRICFYNVTYDEEENELYADIEIFRKKPDISITKTINETEFFIGDEAEVTITLTNNGDNAEKVILSDSYPKEIEIYDVEGGCNKHEGEVYWQGHMDADETKECTFIIKIVDELHRSLKAKVEYWDGYRWLEEYSSTVTMDVEPAITMEARIIREDFEVDGTTFDLDEDNEGGFIGETMRLLLNITSDYHDDLTIDSLDINLPSNLRFISTL
jgi:uncharacterized repeat protein (TIGR01451 family)